MSDETNVVSSSDVAKVTPQSFADLKKPELVEAADLFGADNVGNVKELRANLAEAGVTWEMYATAKQLPGYEDKTLADFEKFTLPEPTNVEDWPDEEAVNEVREPQTAAPHPVLPTDVPYLIKMTRENPYFEFENKKFTQENPYAIMDAQQAQRILEREEGFRQAYPAELAEFYDK